MSKIFHIGNKVYPVKIDGSQCNATKKEMSYLYGIVTGVEDNGRRYYSVEWLDERTYEPAEFDHGLKNAWFDAVELTCSLGEYVRALDDLDDDGEEDLDEVVNRLCDVVDDELGRLCEEYNLDPCEYADIIIEQLCDRLQ